MVYIKVNKIIFFLISVFVLISNYSFSQVKQKPKLVVGIVIDQMRAEYLYRFQANYSENGFKRIIREGFNVKNMHYNYVPTATSPGHASIYTGTTPANHGIVVNQWYNRKSQKVINCVEDDMFFLVDGHSENKKEVSEFSRSPRSLQSTTITDELKLFTNNHSKVIGISIKDRGAILPAGNMANYAFWYNSNTGDFITSTYYSNTLPLWLKSFNKRLVADSLLNLTWDTSKPINHYKNSGPDDAKMEKIFVGKEKSVFPYNLKKLRKKNGNFALLKEVAFGNTIVTELAKATILGEKLGKRNYTDFLTISYSSTDYIGHTFGIRSKEIEDAYVRMDSEVAELLKFLDNHIGKKQYLLFLTADHAAGDNPPFLNKMKLPGEFIHLNEIKNNLNKQLSSQYGNRKYVAFLDKTQLYFNDTKVSKTQLINTSVEILSQIDGIRNTYVTSLNTSRNLKVDTFFRNSYNNINSGDILLHFHSGWIPTRKEGTTHGSSYTYDTHVPMLWYGWGISSGSSVEKHTIDQIAPTLSMLLDIPFPNASSNDVIKEVID